MNVSKLKGKLKECEMSYERCSNELDISITAFSNKMNSKVAFTVPEAEKLSNILNLSDEEKIDIFFR